MMRSSLVLLLLLAACGGPEVQGPVLNPTVTRSPVVFESSMAESTFVKSMDERYKEGEGYVQSMHARLSKNAFYNQHVQIADRDGDGIITDREASEYAGSRN